MLRKKCLAAMSAAIMLFCSCAEMTDENHTQQEVLPDTATQKQEQQTTTTQKYTSVTEQQAAEANAEPQTETRVHFLCAGDNLIHDNIYMEALQLGGGEKYDFSSMYDEVRPYIQKADIAVLNQETLVNSAFPASTYPVFSTPVEDGDAVTDLGFNVISMSNNHVLDYGSEGLISSLDYWDSKDVVHYGAYRDEEDSENIRIKEVNGITFAFLGYMEHTNGNSLASDEPGKVVYLKEEDVIERQIKKADEMADVVVVSCHFGTEIKHELNEQQIDMAPKLAEWGADLIIGTQAHCTSTCGTIDRSDGSKAFCYYGLGNFFHTMWDAISAVGYMGDLDIVKDPNGVVRFENIKAIPVVSHFEDTGAEFWTNCKVYPYSKYTDELISRSGAIGMSREAMEDCLSCIPDEYLSIE